MSIANRSWHRTRDRTGNTLVEGQFRKSQSVTGSVEAALGAMKLWAPWPSPMDVRRAGAGHTGFLCPESPTFRRGSGRISADAEAHGLHEQDSEETWQLVSSPETRAHSFQFYSNSDCLRGSPCARP